MADRESAEHPVLFQPEMVRATLREVDPKTQTRRIVKWKALEPGYNIRFSGLSAGHYCTGVPSSGWVLYSMGGSCWQQRTKTLHCPYGIPGDRLWGREAWATRLDRDHLKPRELDPARDTPFFWADPQTCNTGCAGAAGRRRASFHLPRWASRITLEVTEVRVQRLRDISEEDAKAEGVEHNHAVFHDAIQSSIENTYTRNYAVLWDRINAKPKPVLGDDGKVDHYVSYPWDGTYEIRTHRGKNWLVAPNPWVFAISFKMVQA